MEMCIPMDNGNNLGNENGNNLGNENGNNNGRTIMVITMVEQ